MLFPHVIPGVTRGDDGQPVFPQNMAELILATAVCPRCQSTNNHVYTLPEATARRAELEAELAASRAARHDARQQGTAASGEHRPPQEIMDEISALPKLYLATED
jgi:hypothetical protein